MKMKSIILNFAVEPAFEHFTEAQIKQSIVDAIQEHMRARLGGNDEHGDCGSAQRYVRQRYAGMDEEFQRNKVVEITGKLALDESLTSAVRDAEVREYDNKFGDPVFYIP